MKKRSGWMILLVLLLCLAGPAGCGPSQTAGGDSGAEADGRSEDGTDPGALEASDAQSGDAAASGQEQQTVKEYDYGDVEGCWYSSSSDGRLYLMRIYQVSKEDEERRLLMECLEDPEFNYAGKLHLTSYTDDAGTEMTYCDIMISDPQEGIVGETGPQNGYMGELFEDGTFRFSPSKYMNEEGEIIQALHAYPGKRRH